MEYMHSCIGQGCARFRGRVLSTSDSALDIARFLPLLSDGGVALDWLENWRTLGDLDEAGNTGFGACIRIFTVCFTAVVGVGGNGVSTYSEKT